MPAQAERRSALEVADELAARLDRVNAWCAELHRRLWALEQLAGISSVSVELSREDVQSE